MVASPPLANPLYIAAIDSQHQFIDKVATVVVAEEESNNQERRTRHRGSIPDHNIVNRNRKEGELRLYNDYFTENPKFTESQFQRRFRMSCRLFLRIANAVEAHNPYFKQRTNVLGVLGLSCLQKVTAAHKILAYGIPADLTDEYLRIGETTAIESLRAFVKAIVEVFGDWYLRVPNEADICRLLSIGEQRGFPAEGRTAPVNYTINGHEYTMGYYLADEIYPNWSTFVKTIPRPLGVKRKYFASKQESTRKDVERAFGVFQSRFAIVCGPVRYWNEETLAYIMKACIIIHNMIIEGEGAMNFGFDHEHEVNFFISVSHGEIPELHDFLQTHNRIRDRATSSQLQEDLIEHLWEQYGNE
ncbi:uncharacterized protein LOC112327996 [Populus trichocarpa]|uniref:uncharacterized protein LOC112327996 n=1 Tax=Populus trichocarpa TaxID=3694 RepID=UPI00227795DD|nr:uncharacterized protein LOC112327996 [Populus trichocarpa]